ncbi:MAG TPA: response regulator transcription factor [Anaerolineales bacterium]|nr:response regulator transcription factor [Anaerolineales bacterium]HNO30965.1 response regulator transcription factor [Anaerolineales bacterium]HUM26441.1 response regulator transcription factor [Anaerolineales bacterium]
MIRLIIADDHPVVRSGLKAILASQPDFELVADVDNGDSALSASVNLRPDVILMDLQMPVMDGVTATARIHAELPAARILVLTTYDTDADILRALDAGATGYLLKDAPPEELFRAIRAAAKGEVALAPSIAAKLTRRLTNTSEKSLSAREIEALTLAARGDSNKDIAAKLHITEATVKSHFVHIFEKLGVADRTAAVTTAIEKRIIRLE